MSFLLFGMLDSFLLDNHGFSLYNFEHVTVLVLFVLSCLFGFYWIRKNLSEQEQISLAVWLCGLAMFFQLLKVTLRLYLGVFDHREDLPLQLCNMLPFAMFYVMKTKNRKLFGVLFFWIMAGTFQSLITPTLKDSFPHYESMRYWVVHGGLSYIALYGVFVYRWHLTFKDAILSAIGMNILALCMTPINLLLGSNYLYLIDKPPGKTMYDLLGPWPWYILSLEGVIVVLFGLLLIPFYVYRWLTPNVND